MRKITNLVLIALTLLLWSCDSCDDVTGPDRNNGKDKTPKAPSNLNANVTSSDRINLTWLDNSDNEDGFIIEMRTPNSNSYEEKASVGTDITEYSVTGLQPRTRYHFKVKAYNEIGHSQPSSEESVTTPGITDILYPVKDATIVSKHVFVNGRDVGFDYENEQNPMRVGTHAEVIAGSILNYYRFGCVLNFGDIKRVVNSRNRKIKAAFIIFDLLRKSNQSFGISTAELISNSWSEYNVTYSNVPNIYNNSKFYSKPFIQDGKFGVDVTHNIELIVNSNRVHGGLVLYTTRDIKLGNYYSFNSSETSQKESRPVLIIEYE